MANDLPPEPAPQPPDLTFNLRSVSISTPSPYHENPVSLKRVVGHFLFSIQWVELKTSFGMERMRRDKKNKEMCFIQID